MISILTPAFNEEKYLPQMLESVMQQTASNWEVILVDDGSQDSTAELLESWAARDERFKLVSARKKLGKVRAFNLAHEHASGDLICHVGADDVLPKDSLEVRTRALAGLTEPAVMLGKFKMIDADGQAVSGPMPRGKNGSQSSPGATYNRPLSKMIFPVPESLPSEDIWLGNAAVGCAKSVVHSQRVIIDYRVHGGNSNPRSKTFEAMDRAIQARMEAFSLLVESDLPLNPNASRRIRSRIQLEALRRNRRTIKVLAYGGAPLVDRLATLSMTTPALWRARQRLGPAATGWRGQ